MAATEPSPNDTHSGGYDIPEYSETAEVANPFEDSASHPDAVPKSTTDAAASPAATPGPAKATASPSPPHITTTSPPPPMTASAELSAPPASIEAPDPAIASLVAIFPTFDHELLKDILEQCNGNEDQAVDVLLGISDPSHVPATVPANAQDHDLGLDEQLAQQLMLEDQHQQSRSARRQQQQQYQDVPYAPRASNPKRRSGGLPPEQSLEAQFRDFIMPKRGNRDEQRAPSPSQVGGPVGGNIQEQFTKLADTGKKTFDTLFNKVKAKLSAIDTPPGGALPSAPGFRPDPYAPLPEGSQSQSQSQFQAGPSNLASQSDGDAAPWNSQHGTTSVSITPDIAQPAPTSSRRWTYEDPAQAAQGSTLPTPAIAVPARPPSAGAGAGSNLGVPAAGAAAVSTSPPAASGIDRAKLGLLPKRPVSLMATPVSSNDKISKERDWDNDDDLYE